jgi:hypothetical protein
MTHEYTDKRIRQARLIVASPEQVLTELEGYGVELKSDGIFNSDSDLEQSLLARSDPLIDIGLARYAGEKEVVAALYHKSLAKPADHLQERYLRGLRIACLSNEVVTNPMVSFLENVLGIEEFTRLIREGDSDECFAFLTNPRIGDEVLETLYKNEGLFVSLSDERRRSLVNGSINNPRLTMKKDSEGYLDYGYRAIHEGIFTLLSCAPTTELWLFTLRQLLDELDPGDIHFPKNAILPILDRWAQVLVTKEENGYFTTLSGRDEFLCLVAAMYGRHYSRGKDNKLTDGILGSPDSPDMVLRCTYYGKAQLTKQKMEEGFARDHDFYLLAVLCNNWVFDHPYLRKLLEDEQLHGNLRYVYQRRCEQIHMRKPEFDPRPVSDWWVEDALPESQELTILKKLETTLASMTNAFKSIQTWIFWGFLILGVLELYQGR